ncbi:MAG TPA: chromosome segregation protein SMC [Chthoniobacterales bacterium]|nr:chromosome segregation protein SMC [Chthoniobacterales bacterium]
MHLQSLELFGFKSFADKTVFNFHEGVTAIVGPNGCGKSNVLDAVRWVLGEQSAKALRGGEMADVIFNGTDNRKPVGYAEVSLTFTNCASELGVDWHDVRVTRRVHRDGISEYLLNKTVCRLKDIQALFADTGIGRSAYSMMEQGRIDQILSSHPEDRRAVFEEAAGITKYKTQKREALRKLEATEANLLRLGDIIKEVKRQIGSLQRQAGKARRFQTVLADLQVLDTHHSRAQLDLLQNELEQSRAAAAHFDEQQRTGGREIEEQENAVTAQRAKLEEVDTRINAARGDVQRLQNQIASHRNRIDFNLERAQELAALIGRYELDVETAEAKRAQQETEIHDTDLLLAETERLVAAKQTELTELTERATAVRQEREERERELQTLELAISKAENRLADLESDLSGTRSRRAATEPRLVELAASLGEAARARDLVASQVTAAAATANEQQEALRDLATQIPAAEEEVSRRQQELREAEAALIASDRAIAERQSRLDILKQLNAEGAGLTEGSQAVLRGLDDPARILPALSGALASLIEVEEEFIPAVEAALGRNLHAIVLQDGALATEIIAIVTARKLGQTALISPGLCVSSPIVANELPPGGLAWATEKVQAPAGLEALVSHLLGHVVLVADLDLAQRMKKEWPAFAFATLTGDFVSSKGVIYGGRANEEKSSLFARKAQVASLAAEHGRLRDEQQQLRAQRAAIERRLAEAAERLEEIRAQHQGARADYSATALQLAALERELHEAGRKADAVDWERSTIEQQLSSAAERIVQLETEAATHRAFLDQSRERQVALLSATETARLRDEELVEQLSELRLAVATERQRHEGLRSQRLPMTARQAELAELIASRRTDIANYVARREQQSEETAAAERSIEENSTELSRAEAAVAEIESTRAAHLAGVNTLEADLRARRKALSNLHEARGREEVRQTQMQLKIENIAEHVMRRYQVDLHDFAPDRYAFTKTYRAQIKQRGKAETEIASDAAAEFDEAQLREIIEQLTRQLDAMGPVNLDAVHEYDELEERHTFLETQNTDLTNSRRELLDVIARINQTTEKLFAETFAQVRINFREMFAELFGGGRADLALLDEGDALNCGIDIIAKPPGKQLQSVSLLSGGERTMTAVALLFAIYMVRPSPFCILDEMDAPLDESNINRFIKMLDRFVSQSQFVIITHNKRTIAKADILYGVTMEERGISKLVGMRLTSARPVEARAATKEETRPEQRALDLEESSPNHIALAR